jgi:co-chaperonin GroES (HSP10)
MRKDTLAAGAKKATFTGGFGEGELRPPVAVEEPETADPLPSHVDNLARFELEKSPTIYKGQPLGDMVLVKRVERESRSRIILADVARGKSDTGIVVGVGEGKIDITTGKRTPLSVKQGDLVLFDKFATVGMEVQLADEGGEAEHLLVREHDILLILTEVRN